MSKRNYAVFFVVAFQENVEKPKSFCFCFGWLYFDDVTLFLFCILLFVNDAGDVGGAGGFRD